METDELEQLMPSLLNRAQGQGSPADTGAMREYIRVLGEKPVNVPAGAAMPLKPRIDRLQTRAGSGRRPPRRFFTIKWRTEESEPEVEEQVEVDPEALKDALLEQAKAQRQALMQAALRPGTGRVPRCREVAIVLPPLQLEEEEEEEEQHEEDMYEQQQEEGDMYEQHQHQEGEIYEEEAGAAMQLLDGGEVEGQAWEAIEGVMAEQQAQVAMQPAAADDLPTSTAATPGAALLHQHGSLQQEHPDSQHGRAKTPASSLFGRYTPMEGVPERTALLSTRGKQPPATVSRSTRLARTPAGFTPTEGIPERLLAFQAPPLGPLGATFVASNLGLQSVDSPVEGLVQQGMRRSKDSTAAAAPPQPSIIGCGGFAGFSPSLQQAVEAERQPEEAVQQAGESEQQQQQQEQQRDGEQGGVDEDDDNGDFGFQDDGGYYEGDDGAASPAAAQPGDAAGGFPFLAGGAAAYTEGAAAYTEDACVQTGASLGAEERAHGAEMDIEGAYDGGYDAGGDYGEVDGYGLEPGFDAGLPEPSAAPQQQQQHERRKATKDPGVRLRNELKRKSLAVDPTIGRREVLPGVRRSCRSKQGPLKWWLNERQEFGRQHQTMPTVRNVVHKIPNTPWQTVTDIRRRPTKRQRAATPHDLGAMLGDAADGEAAAAGEAAVVDDAAEAEEEQGWEVDDEEEVVILDDDGDEVVEVVEEQEEVVAVEEEQLEVEELGEDGMPEAAADEEQRQMEQQGQRRSGRQQETAQPSSRRQRGKAAAVKGKAGKKEKAAGSRRSRRR